VGDLTGLWSRRLTEADRMVDDVTVTIYQLRDQC